MESTPFPTKKVYDVLDLMRDTRVSFMDVLSCVMNDETPRCAAYRRRVLGDLELIFTWVSRYKSGRATLKKWALDLMCKVVDQEMRKTKQAFTMKTTEITTDFVEAWSFSGLQNTVKENAPTLCELLYAGVQTKRARSKGKKDPMAVCAAFRHFFPHQHPTGHICYCIADGTPSLTLRDAVSSLARAFLVVEWRIPPEHPHTATLWALRFLRFHQSNPI